MRRIRDVLLNGGFTDSLLFTADGGDQLAAGTLPGGFAIGANVTATANNLNAALSAAITAAGTKDLAAASAPA